MGIFNKKPAYRRDEIRTMFDKSSGKIPFGGGRRFSQSDRGKMFKDLFGRELDVSKYDYQRTVKRLSQEQRGTQDVRTKRELGDKLRFLKDLEKRP